MANVADLLREVAVYRRLVGTRIRGEMQYPASFALQVAGSFAFYMLSLAAIFILFRHFETMAGWRVGEIAFLYGLSGLAFGIAHLLATGFTDFSRMVLRGEFDRVLVRPLGTMPQVLASDVQLRRIGDMLQGAAALAIAFRLVDIEWTLGRALYLPVVVLSASLLFLALFSLQATLCFWTTEGTEVINSFTYGGRDLTRYPLHIFDLWLRRLFLFAIPAGFVVYAPSLYLLDKPDPLHLPTVTRYLAPGAALAFALLAAAAWRLGVRHYRSTGT